jgi:hypothetical protein
MLDRKASHSDDGGITNPALASSKKEKFMPERFSQATWSPRQEALYASVSVVPSSDTEKVVDRP